MSDSIMDLVGRVRNGANDVASGTIPGLVVAEATIKEFQQTLRTIDPEASAIRLVNAYRYMADALTQIEGAKLNLDLMMTACEEWVQAVSS